MPLGLGLDLVLHIFQCGVLRGNDDVRLGLNFFQSGDDSVLLGGLLYCGHNMRHILLMMDDLAPLLLSRDDVFRLDRDGFDCDIVRVLPHSGLVACWK